MNKRIISETLKKENYMIATMTIIFKDIKSNRKLSLISFYKPFETALQIISLNKKKCCEKNQYFFLLSFRGHN